ncbi:DeoR/GlpR family DNA-binding transcription regulator [Vibrio quintilis]|uniref:Glycerol-3-phosphate regulon repressor n=1 Tax=Vibrio quintilis TaxID=1117707 RepID=A0A1M7Z2R0_9VIBR|nr:DeoR/GlpR family DNA-binding transcription regulator [Vibrio quintilis]SHO58936.1 Glycerol-3-phosphate regulon repressor [Vibrio quintilis]
MLQHVRLHRIQTLLSNHQQVSTERLIRELGVSRETIRRDIITLENQNLVRRVHGGIVAIQKPQQEAPLTERQARQTKEKKAIAQTLAEMLSPGQTIFLDSGSTTTRVAEALSTMSGLTIITNNIQAALCLNASEGREQLNNQILLLGGDLQADAKETRGEETLNTVYRYRADVAVLSPVGICSHGTSSFYHWESAIAEAMIRQSNQCILLADHTKIGKQSRFYYARPEQVTSVITDSKAVELAQFNELEQLYRQIMIAK